MYKSRARKRSQEGNRDARPLGGCLSAQCGSETERGRALGGCGGTTDLTGTGTLLDST